MNYCVGPGIRGERLHSKEAHGFTLVELMISVALGGVILAAAATTIVSHIRSSATQEAVIRLQDHWARVNVLLTTEIAEADTFSTDGVCNLSASLLTLNVPTDAGTGVTVPIRYAVAGGALFRCGPSINANGTLDFSGTPVTSQLVGNANLAVVITTNRRPTYTLTLTDPTGVTFANQVSANRSRSRIIDN